MVSMTCAANGRPASGCRTLGSAECMRLPCPAARIATLSGVVTMDRLLTEDFTPSNIRADATVISGAGKASATRSLPS